jgi:hypothetical protein
MASGNRRKKSSSVWPFLMERVALVERGLRPVVESGPQKAEAFHFHIARVRQKQASNKLQLHGKCVTSSLEPIHGFKSEALGLDNSPDYFACKLAR